MFLSEIDFPFIKIVPELILRSPNILFSNELFPDEPVPIIHNDFSELTENDKSLRIVLPSIFRDTFLKTIVFFMTFNATISHED